MTDLNGVFFGVLGSMVVDSIVEVCWKDGFGFEIFHLVVRLNTLITEPSRFRLKQKKVVQMMWGQMRRRIGEGWQVGKYLKEIGLKNSRNKTVWISTFIYSMDIVFFLVFIDWILVFFLLYFGLCLWWHLYKRLKDHSVVWSMKT